MIRQLGAGAVLGELALITGGTRSASIRARRDSHLLRVSHQTFDRVVSDDARAMKALTEVLARQLQDAAPAAPGRPPRARVVAVVALHPGAPAEAVADALGDHLAGDMRLVRPGRVGPDGLERAERESECVLLVADDPSDEWWAMCVRQADLLIVVAAADARCLRLHRSDAPRWTSCWSGRQPPGRRSETGRLRSAPTASPRPRDRSPLHCVQWRLACPVAQWGS